MQIAGKREGAYERGVDRAESSRRYNASQNEDEDGIIKMINEAKNAGRSWEQIADTLAGGDIDVGKGSVADNELRRIHGYEPVKAGPEKEPTVPEKDRNRYDGFMQEINSGSEEFYIKDGDIWQASKRKWYRNDPKEMPDDFIVMTNPYL